MEEQDPQSRGVWSRQKNGLRMRPCCRGRRLSAVSQALNVSRAQLSVRVHRKPGWQDGRHHRQRDDAALLGRIMEAMAELPPMAIAGSGRCYGVSLRQQNNLW